MNTSQGLLGAPEHNGVRSRAPPRSYSPIIEEKKKRKRRTMKQVVGASPDSSSSVEVNKEPKRPGRPKKTVVAQEAVEQVAELSEVAEEEAQQSSYIPDQQIADGQIVTEVVTKSVTTVAEQADKFGEVTSTLSAEQNRRAEQVHQNNNMFVSRMMAGVEHSLSAENAQKERAPLVVSPKQSQVQLQPVIVQNLFDADYLNQFVGLEPEPEVHSDKTTVDFTLQDVMNILCAPQFPQASDRDARITQTVNEVAGDHWIIQKRKKAQRSLQSKLAYKKKASKCPQLMKFDQMEEIQQFTENEKLVKQFNEYRQLDAEQQSRITLPPLLAEYMSFKQKFEKQIERDVFTEALNDLTTMDAQILMDCFQEHKTNEELYMEATRRITASPDVIKEFYKRMHMMTFAPREFEKFKENVVDPREIKYVALKRAPRNQNQVQHQDTQQEPCQLSKVVSKQIVPQPVDENQIAQAVGKVEKFAEQLYPKLQQASQAEAMAQEASTDSVVRPSDDGPMLQAPDDMLVAWRHQENKRFLNAVQQDIIRKRETDPMYAEIYKKHPIWRELNVEQKTKALEEFEKYKKGDVDQHNMSDILRQSIDYLKALKKTDDHFMTRAVEEEFKALSEQDLDRLAHAFIEHASDEESFMKATMIVLRSSPPLREYHRRKVLQRQTNEWERVDSRLTAKPLARSSTVQPKISRNEARIGENKSVQSVSTSLPQAQSYEKPSATSLEEALVCHKSPSKSLPGAQPSQIPARGCLPKAQVTYGSGHLPQTLAFENPFGELPGAQVFNKTPSRSISLARSSENPSTTSLPNAQKSYPSTSSGLPQAQISETPFTRALQVSQNSAFRSFAEHKVTHKPASNVLGIPSARIVNWQTSVPSASNLTNKEAIVPSVDNTPPYVRYHALQQKIFEINKNEGQVAELVNNILSKEKQGFCETLNSQPVGLVLSKIFDGLAQQKVGSSGKKTTAAFHDVKHVSGKAITSNLQPVELVNQQQGNGHSTSKQTTCSAELNTGLTTSAKPSSSLDIENVIDEIDDNRPGVVDDHLYSSKIRDDGPILNAESLNLDLSNSPTATTMMVDKPVSPSSTTLPTVDRKRKSEDRSNAMDTKKPTEENTPSTSNASETVVATDVVQQTVAQESSSTDRNPQITAQKQSGDSEDAPKLMISFNSPIVPTNSSTPPTPIEKEADSSESSKKLEKAKPSTSNVVATEVVQQTIPQESPSTDRNLQITAQKPSGNAEDAPNLMTSINSPIVPTTSSTPPTSTSSSVIPPVSITAPTPNEKEAHTSESSTVLEKTKQRTSNVVACASAEQTRKTLAECFGHSPSSRFFGVKKKRIRHVDLASEIDESSAAKKQAYSLGVSIETRNLSSSCASSPATATNEVDEIVSTSVQCLSSTIVNIKMEPPEEAPEQKPLHLHLIQNTFGALQDVKPYGMLGAPPLSNCCTPDGVEESLELPTKITPEAKTLYLPDHGKTDWELWTEAECLEWAKKFVRDPEQVEFLVKNKLNGFTFKTIVEEKDVYKEINMSFSLYCLIRNHFNTLLNYQNGYRDYVYGL